MIHTEDSPTSTAADIAPDPAAEARPWSSLAEHARRELEAWAQSRPREHHRAERLESISHATRQP